HRPTKNVRARSLPQSPRDLDIEQLEMRSAFQFDSSPAAIDVRYAAGEEHDCPWTCIAVSWHKGAFELKQRTVELALPSHLHKRQPANQIRRLRIDPDLELIYLSTDNHLCPRTFEFRSQHKSVTIGRNRGGRCRVAQNRSTNQRKGV